MDYEKMGKLILGLRRETGMTQKALADQMHISDRTISKWERGLGCPDVSLLGKLSDILGVNIEKILAGDLNPNNMDGGNMKRVKFYVCPDCGNVLFATGEAEVSCCGRKLSPLEVKEADGDHEVHMDETEDEFYITLDHDMEKQHYISFIAYAAYDRILVVKLYPEQAAAVRFPRMRGGRLYVCCSRHGLMQLVSSRK